MSSRKGGGKPFNAGSINNTSSRGKSVPQVSAPDHLAQGLADVTLDSTGGEWEVYARKSKNKVGADSGKPWVHQNPNSRPWGHPDVISKLNMRNDAVSGKASGSNYPTQAADSKKVSGRGGARPQSSNKGLETKSVARPAVISAPLEGGWNWSSRPGASQLKGCEDGIEKEDVEVGDGDGDGSESDVVNDSDDDVFSDDFDSDESQKSHDTLKKNRWFRSFFEILDTLTIDEIGEPGRQWHCPACQGGPGAIDWYRGLQPLISHANTKGAQRVKLHRDFAKLLNEELRRRGTSCIPAGEAFGKWKGLEDQDKDHEIVWPPMVVIMNTKLELDEKEKWVGMGNQELLEYFNSYAAVKARHSYGPKGHRGMSLLIFEPSAMGYVEAERLHKHFEKQRADRYAWEHNPVRFYPGGKRQLYGYLAQKKDMESFNQHAQGKSKLKYEIRSYQEMVVSQMKQMNEDNQQLMMFKDKVARVERRSKALEESFGIVTEKLRKTIEENRIVRQRTKMHHEQNKEEMDFQEQFFKDQIQIIHEARDAKEDQFEMLQQEEREKVRQANANPSAQVDQKYRTEEVEEFIKSQDKEMEAFVAEREALIHRNEEKKAEMRRGHLAELLELEKEIDEELTQLMKKYTPNQS